MLMFVCNYRSLKTDGIESLIDDDADLLNSAANNLAICALYCCDVKRAVQCLEVRSRVGSIAAILK